MTEENKFFRLVWRFNALIVAVAGLGVLALLAFATYNILSRPAWTERPEGHFAPVSSAAQAKNTYRLRAAGSVAFVKPGAQEVDLVFSLGDWDGNPAVYGLQHMSGSSGPSEAYNANLLLVNAETGEGRWLFSGVARNIEGWDTVIDRSAKNPVDVTATGQAVIVAAGTPQRYFGDTPSVVAMVLRVIEKDRNGDGALTDKDGIAFYVYRSGDKDAAKLLDADLVLSQAQIGADRYAISYEAKGAAFIAVYSVPDFKLVAKKPLPKLPG